MNSCVKIFIHEIQKKPITCDTILFSYVKFFSSHIKEANSLWFHAPCFVFRISHVEMFSHMLINEIHSSYETLISFHLFKLRFYMWKHSVYIFQILNFWGIFLIQPSTLMFIYIFIETVFLLILIFILSSFREIKGYIVLSCFKASDSRDNANQHVIYCRC